MHIMRAVTGSSRLKVHHVAHHMLFIEMPLTSSLSSALRYIQSLAAIISLLN